MQSGAHLRRWNLQAAQAWVWPVAEVEEQLGVGRVRMEDEEEEEDGCWWWLMRGVGMVDGVGGRR